MGFYPGKDEKPGVVGDKMDMPAPTWSIPPDVSVPAPDMPRGGRPGKAGNRPSTSECQIFEMFSNGSCITEIVELSEQSVMEFLESSTSYLMNGDWTERGNVAPDRALIDCYRFGRYNVATARGAPLRGQLDILFGFKAQKKSATNHVFGKTIGLRPVPDSADLAGQGRPVIVRIARDEIPDEIDVTLGDRTPSVNKNLFHASIHILTRT